MSDSIAVEIKELSKMYKLYSSKRARILDLFNLKFAMNKDAYQEFWALRDINLWIPKGGKVGIIGRNGAGKSTLLKIICGNIEATTGAVRVNGRVSALLELGTGFHPEFSGRENAFASLAYMGVTDREAIRKFDEILDFSELEEFIDNPLKTYSAGMYARLAFSVATCIRPEILIIDEVLGAGDAYFAMKCVDRMMSLTSSGSTVLFVSHDIASVQRLCDKAIWIEKGRIIMEGDTLSVSKSYGASVREQEEIRLKAGNLGLSQKTMRQMKNSASDSLLFHLTNDKWTTFSGRHPVKRIGWRINGNLTEEIKVGDAMDNDISAPAHIITAPGYIDWSEPVKMDGGYARIVEDREGEYRHAAFMLPMPVRIEEIGQALLEIDYKDVSDEAVFVELYDGEKYNRTGQLDSSNDGKWKTVVIEMLKIILKGKTGEDGAPDIAADALMIKDHMRNDGETAGEAGPVSHHIAGDVYGTGEAVITRAQFLDRDNREMYVFTTGETMKIRIFYRTVAPVSQPVFAASIYRMDGVVITQSLSSKDSIHFGIIDGAGKVDIIYDPLFIGAGDYIVTVAIFHYVDLLNPTECPAYCLHDRKYHFKVKHPAEYALDLGVVNQPVVWSHEISNTERSKARM